MNAVDTNVRVYATDRRDPAKQQRARDLLSSLKGAVLLWQVACEFIAATRKIAADGYRAEDALGESRRLPGFSRW